MDEYKELTKSIQDIREWLVRIDSKLVQLSDVKNTAETAEKIARDAMALALENARGIAEIKADDRRKWQVITGMGTSFIVSILLYFLTK